MKKIVCDICGKELSMSENYDEDGYSQFVNVEVRNSRTYGGECDICNFCFNKILGFAQDMRKGQKNDKL